VSGLAPRSTALRFDGAVRFLPATWAFCRAQAFVYLEGIVQQLLCQAYWIVNRAMIISVVIAHRERLREGLHRRGCHPQLFGEMHSYG